MSIHVHGRTKWSLSRDKDGHREYSLHMLVETTDPDDGPEVILGASGLPAIGATWSFGNDDDPWALCWPDVRVDPIVSNEPNLWWDLQYTFSTRPLTRCQDSSITDPLLEPQGVSGSFIKYDRKTERDRNNKPILSSSHEIIPVDRDANRPTVTISQNVTSLGLATFTEMIDTLNDSSLWGLAARCIKLSNASWERKLYGTCTYYYTRRFEFDINFNTFDFDSTKGTGILDVGFKHLKGVWNKANPPEFEYDAGADKDDPKHFIRIKDSEGSPTPKQLALDGNGKINTDPANSPVYLPKKEIYGQSNFLLLNIPTSF